MKKWGVLGLLILAGSSLACSKVKGYVANGLAPTPSYLIQDCSVNYKYYSEQIGSLGTASYAELYKVKDISRLSKFLTTTTKNKGYVQISADKTDVKNQMYVYANVPRRVAFNIFTSPDGIYLGVVGK